MLGVFLIHCKGKIQSILSPDHMVTVIPEVYFHNIQKQTGFNHLRLPS